MINRRSSTSRAMAYPYTVTVAGLLATMRQLRTAFPPLVTADTLKKWGIAPNNEAYIVTILRFLGIIDDEGRKLPEKAKAFSEHDDEQFAAKFEALVRTAYAGLFDHFGDNAWALDRNRLIAFFRAADDTSARVGLQQAVTFTALAQLAGHGQAPVEPRAQPARSRAPAASPKKRGSRSRGGAEVAATPPPSPPPARETPGSLAMTVRIEINLPVSDDQDVYDKIFRSIRSNLLNE